MDKILILDFGSQYTQLIARRIRELSVYSVIEPYNISLEKIKEYNPKGIILSGGPNSVYEEHAPKVKKGIFSLGIPVLGICYGMQLIMKTLGGEVKASDEREYGKAVMKIDSHKTIFNTFFSYFFIINITFTVTTDYFKTQFLGYFFNLINGTISFSC